MNTYIKCLILFLTITACSKKENISNKLNGMEILKKSIETHDPNDIWDKLKLFVHIQEPRLSNPSRYSELKLNNVTSSFELRRNRDNYISKHVIDEQGNSKVYLDGREDIADSLIKKYRLTPERNNGYKDFYKMLYGLPMSLEDRIIPNNIKNVEVVKYNNQECYKVGIELKEEMFSKTWEIYISTSSYEIKGIEMIFPEDKTKGERLYFEGKIEIGEINIPRIRHWYEYSNDKYSGSDIIVKELLE